MREYWKIAAVSMVLISVLLSGCQKKAFDLEAQTKAQATEELTEETVARSPQENSKTDLTTPETYTLPNITYETNAAVQETTISKTFRLETDAADTLAPTLSLFDDGTFGFSYDVLSSYYNHGTYELAGDKLIAATADGLYQYVFKAEENRLIFIQSESSDISMIDKSFGVPVTDGAVFVYKEDSVKSLSMMTAAVKEIGESSLLVSSRSDDFPGAYYVYFGNIDISQIKGGDQIVVFWDGTVMETDPAQIYAERIESSRVQANPE